MRIYKAHEVDNQRFYQVPKSLFGNPRYKGLSLEAKMIYAILRDRMELSRRNGWVNERGEVYLKFKREDLMTLLECGSRTTMAKMMKQLRDFELICERRLGLGMCNEVYVCHVETDECPNNEPLKFNDWTTTPSEVGHYNETNVIDTDIRETTTGTTEDIVVVPIVNKANEDLPKGITVKLLDKLRATHTDEVIQRQLKNLRTALTTQKIKNTAGWLTTACNEDYDSTIEPNLFAPKVNYVVADEPPVEPMPLSEDFKARLLTLPNLSQFAQINP